MDRVANIIQQVNNGKMSEYDAIKQLEYYMRSDESNQYKQEKKFLIQEHTQVTGDPLDIIIARETLDDIVSLVNSLLSHLSIHYRRIFYLYVVENYTMSQIGDKMNISKQAVYTYLKRIKAKLSRHLTEKDRELLYKMGGTSFSKHISRGFPYEIASSVFVDSRYTKAGEFKSRYRCGIKEYMSGGFHDDNTACSLCYKKCNSDKMKNKVLEKVT